MINGRTMRLVADYPPPLGTVMISDNMGKVRYTRLAPTISARFDACDHFLLWQDYEV